MPKVTDIPDCPGVPAVRSSGEVTREYQIRLITPMFGGGATAGEPDESMPIRGTSIRGQLEFWWRATRGAGYSTWTALFARHAEIWGKTETASRVQVEVREVRVQPTRPCAIYEFRPARADKRPRYEFVWQEPFATPKTRPWGIQYVPKDVVYALFPFQGEKPADAREGSEPARMPGTYVPEGEFQLRLRFPENLLADVETAVWAWVNFGGLGARTRRGCGALICEELAPTNANNLADWFKKNLAGCDVETRDWPTIPDRFLWGKQGQESLPMDAWNQAVGALRHFRQGCDFARDPGSPPSRSRYPEPDTIRRITKRSSRGHAPAPSMPDGFPRAEFGLPIVFQFKDEGKEDPYKTVLYPFLQEMTPRGAQIDAAGNPVGKTKDRMASPLVIKPLALASGKAVPMILRLNTRPLQRVELQKNDSGKKCLTPGHEVPVRSTAFAKGNSPIAGRSAKGSALEAFLTFVLRERGFQEVTR